MLQFHCWFCDFNNLFLLQVNYGFLRYKHVLRRNTRIAEFKFETVDLFFLDVILVGIPHPTVISFNFVHMFYFIFWLTTPASTARIIIRTTLLYTRLTHDLCDSKTNRFTLLDQPPYMHSYSDEKKSNTMRPLVPSNWFELLCHSLRKIAINYNFLPFFNWLKCRINLSKESSKNANKSYDLHTYLHIERIAWWLRRRDIPKEK